MKLAPRHLQKPGKKFWRETLRAFSLEDPHELELLSQACQCLDRIAAARKDIATTGAVILDRFKQPKESPSIKIERDSMVLFSRLVRELGLSLTEEIRLPGKY